MDATVSVRPLSDSATRVGGLELLGFLRFALACSVAAFHLWQTAFPRAGFHAVVGFFCISGFLVTKIARESYNDRPIAFLFNRFLRIYPTYWVCLIFAIAVGVWFPDIMTLPTFVTNWPKGLGGWINNFDLFTFAPEFGKIIAQAWSLEVELTFYFIIGLCTYRSLALTLLGLSFSLAYAALLIFKLVVGEFYFTASGTAFAFFLGATAYLLSGRFRLGGLVAAAAAVAYAVNMFVLPLALEGHITEQRLNVSVMASAFCAAAILLAVPNLVLSPGRWKSWSSYLGRLSYPIFLLHVFAAAPVAAAIGQATGPLLLASSFVVTMVLSVVIVQLVELPIERLRKVVRAR